MKLSLEFIARYLDFSAEQCISRNGNLSDYDAVGSIVGHECVNEIVVDRLLSMLGIEHVGYQLIHADVMVGAKVYDTWLNASEDFKRPAKARWPSTRSSNSSAWTAKPPSSSACAWAGRSRPGKPSSWIT